MVKKYLVIVMSLFLGLGYVSKVEAAEINLAEDVTEIELFDINDPHLVSVVDINNSVETRSPARPTTHVDLDRGPSSFHLAANYNGTKISWSPYIYDTQSGSGGLVIHTERTSSSGNFHVRVVNCDTGREYTYLVKTQTANLHNDKFGNIHPNSFYFGIDVSQTKNSVIVDGYTHTY